MASHNFILNEFRKAWSASAALTATAGLMLVVFLFSLLGMVVDPRTITGVPAWLKPAKFAISTAIFCATMAWLFRYITIWPRFVRAMGWIVAAVLVLEVAIVDLQAARGVTSHFNIGTALDGALFSVMGLSIVVLWLATVGVLATLFRQKFVEPAWGWWLRTGLLVTVLGSAAGGMMIPPTPEQLERLQSREVVPVIGAHTVGAPDGGPGLPGVGWSTRHGDLRIAHFFGLHGFQILPFIGWFVSRRRSHRIHGHPAALPVAAAASYTAFITILMWQALRGVSVVSFDPATMTALAFWTLASAGVFLYLLRTDSREPSALTRSAI